MGWKIIGKLPDRQFILIVAPHTSNWDVVIGVLAGLAEGARIHFLAKKQLFFFPLGILLRAMGAVPIDRSKKGNMVEQVVSLFQQQKGFKIGLAPEGTRSEVTRWKEGFYHIACQAKIPIVMVGFDYSTKEIRVQEPFWPTNNIQHDFPEIVAFFRTIHGKYQKNLPDYHPK